MVRVNGGDPRIEIEHVTTLSVRFRRELEAFVKHCVRRMERSLGALQSLRLRISTTKRHTFHCAIEADHRGVLVQRAGDAPDAVLATWNAICQLEEALRGHGIVESGR